MSDLKRTVEEKLKRFQAEELRPAALDLLDALGYRSEKTVDFGGSPDAFLEQFDGKGLFRKDKALCDLFDQETQHGRNKAQYNDLLGKAVKSIVAAFKKRMAAGLAGGRDFVLPDQDAQVKDGNDFELVTWLVIKDRRGN